jgi:hypothetical protein
MAIRTIVALFDDYREAEGAVRELDRWAFRRPT